MVELGRKKIMNTQELLTLLQLFLAFCNSAIMIYLLMKFLKKPHDSLSDRVTVLEVEVKDLKASEKHDNSLFKEQDIANEVIIRSTLALIEFEIQYCITENKQPTKELERAKEELTLFLARRRRENE